MPNSRGDFSASRQACQSRLTHNECSLGAAHPSTRVMSLNLAIADLNLGRAAAALRQLDAGRAWFVSYAGGEQGAVVRPSISNAPAR